MKYNTYNLALELLTRTARQRGMINKRVKGNTAIMDASRILYAYTPGILETMEYVIHAEEWHWLNTERVVYYPGSMDLMRSLTAAKFSASDSAAFYDGFESFLLSFPAGVSFSGKPAQSCMITICQHNLRAMSFLNKFTKSMCGVTVPVEHNMHGDGYSISVNYCDHDLDGAYTRLVLDSNLLPQYLACTSVEDHIKLVNKHNDFNYVGGITLSDTDHHYQYELIRFILRFLMYKKALPERIIDGLPGCNRQELESVYTTHRRHRVIQPPKINKESPAAHYRSWHFRQLMHEKYYRNEYAEHEHGSRVIFVSDSFVGNKTTPQTVT